MSDGKSNLAVVLPDGSHRDGRVHIAGGEEFVLFEAPGGARVRAPIESEAVQVLHPGAFSAFICLWVRHQDAVDPREDRKSVKPLSPSELNKLVSKAFAAYNDAMQRGKFGLAVTIAFRWLPNLPVVPGVEPSSQRMRERQYDAVLALYHQQRAAGERFVVRLLREDHAIVRWYEACLAGAWAKALRLARRLKLGRERIAYTIRGRHKHLTHHELHELRTQLEAEFPFLLEG